MSVIKVQDLHKHYGDLQAVDGISFDVNEGEIFGLLGPNGAGKTTTIEIIEGLRPKDNGVVELLNLDVAKKLQDVKETIGVQLQASSMIDLLTVREILNLFSSFYKHRADINKLMHDMNLTEKAKTLTKELSGGQKQRLAIALALVNDPLVVFLDEPTTGLDPQARRSLWEVIRSIQKQKKTVLLTTHYMEEAEVLCDRIAIMDHGKILAMDTPQNLINTYFKEKTIEIEFTEQIPQLDWCKQIPKVESCHADGQLLTLYTTHSQTVLSKTLELAAAEKWTFKDVRIRSATLEDVFLKLTGSRIRE